MRAACDDVHRLDDHGRVPGPAGAVPRRGTPSKRLRHYLAGFSIGAVTDLEADEVVSIIESVHTYVVIPAMQEILQKVQNQ